MSVIWRRWRLLAQIPLFWHPPANPTEYLSNSSHVGDLAALAPHGQYSPILAPSRQPYGIPVRMVVWGTWHLLQYLRNTLWRLLAQIPLQNRLMLQLWFVPPEGAPTVRGNNTGVCEDGCAWVILNIRRSTRSLVTPSSGLHGVKHLKVIGRDVWDRGATFYKQAPPQNGG